MKEILITFIILPLFISCSEMNKRESGAISIDIPDTSFTHMPNLLYERKKKLSSELDLNTLELGKDSFELRLWINAERTNGGQVFVIKKTKHEWNCWEYRYLENSDVSESSTDIRDLIIAFSVDSFQVVNKKPQSGWKYFFEAIREQNIYSLPSQTEIEGWDYKLMDGISYEIECFDKNRYRYYWYNCPDVFEKEFKECAEMTAILEIYDDQFDLGQWPSFRCKN